MAEIGYGEAGLLILYLNHYYFRMESRYLYRHFAIAYVCLHWGLKINKIEYDPATKIWKVTMRNL